MSEQEITTFSFFQQHGVYMLQNGIITSDKYMAYVRYMVYLDFKAQGETHERAIIKSAGRNKCTIHSIYRAIKFMTDPEWRRERQKYRRRSRKRKQVLPTRANAQP